MERRLTLSICVYETMFFISFLEKDGEFSIEIDSDNESKMVKIKSDKELVDYVRANVTQAPLFDEIVLADVNAAVMRTLGYLEMVI